MTNATITPKPVEICSAPELATLAILEYVLDVATRTLVATYPELDDPERPYWLAQPSPSSHIADAVVTTLDQLRERLRAYRQAIADELAPEHPPPDLPF